MIKNRFYISITAQETSSSRYVIARIWKSANMMYSNITVTWGQPYGKSCVDDCQAVFPKYTLFKVLYFILAKYENYTTKT